MQPETGRLRVVEPPERSDGVGAGSDEEAAGETLSPGRYIKNQRKRQGVSLDQLAVATKIPRSSLQVLEDDRYEDLPGPVFVKGFLRCCARALSVDPEVVMDLLYERERAALKARRRDRTPTLTPTPSPTLAPTELPSRSMATAAAIAGRSSARLQRVLDGLPSTSILLWVIVAAVLAMLVMAAFNLTGVGISHPRV